MTQLAREKLLYRYINAIERGDFETVASLLQQAENDAELENMIVGVNEVLSDEYDSVAEKETAELVRHLLEKHLPSGLGNTEDDADIPPITLSNVAERVISNDSLQSHMRKEAKSIAHQLNQTEALLTERFSQRTLSVLFEELGISVSNSLKKLFHETAVFLSMRREQNLAQLAATRRQRGIAKKKNEKGETNE